MTDNVAPLSTKRRESDAPILAPMYPEPPWLLAEAAYVSTLQGAGSGPTVPAPCSFPASMGSLVLYV